MKTRHLKQTTLGLTFVAVLLYGAFFCKKTNDKELPILYMDKATNGLIQIDNEFNNYNQASCNFLQNSSTLNPNEIRNAHCCVNDLYLLFSNLFLHYDLNTGTLISQYEPSELVNFTDFSVNPTNQRVYILDNKSSKLLELNEDKGITKTIQLDTSHQYDKIMHLEKYVFLITVKTVPYPLFVTVNFETGDVKEIDCFIGKRNRILDTPEKSDSTWIKYPLYVADKTQQGVLIKYLFDDRIYLFSNNILTPVFFMNMGKQKVRFKYPWTTIRLKENNRFRIIKFWQTEEKIYVLSQFIVENTKGLFDYKMLSQFKDFELADSFGGFTAESKLATLYPSKDEVFMDDEKKRFLTLRKLNNNEKRDKSKWPPQMINTQNDEDLVVSIFQLK